MNKKTILVVNDIFEDTDTLVRFLKNEYNVYSVDSLSSANKMIKDNTIDLVFLDFSFLEPYFRNENNILKIINIKKIPVMCSMNERDDFLETSILEKGILKCIIKPYNESLLKIKINKVIQYQIDKINIDELVSYKVKEIDKSINSIIIAMSILAESRDKATGEHIFRIQAITRIIINKYKELYPYDLTYKELDEIILFSPLHDIGKVPIPDAVLKKDSFFTSEDFSVMKEHTILGGEMLLKTQENISEDDNFLKVAIEIATYHHEKYDGTGYPYGIKGDEIPLSARIVALADVYEALISPRPYKMGMSHSDVIDIILKGDDRIKPKHFDPKVLNAFKCVLEELKLLS